MTLDLSPEHEELLARYRELATSKFADRASGYDREAAFPLEDFADLIAAGLQAPLIPVSEGGAGLSRQNDLYTIWMITRELARAHMALARCWEGHINCQMLISALGTEEQRSRWFSGVVEQGHKWVAWSGEPQTRSPKEKSPIGTNVTETPEGFIVDGCKIFCTGAPAADWAILLVNTAGPGGGRHADAKVASGLLMLACDLSDPSVTFDDSWWDPIGMRGTVSYLTRFNKTFIPRENLIGKPGQYLADEWQTRITPHYCATFLGGAEAAHEYTLRYLATPGKSDDPFVQQRVGEMAMNIETSHLWMRRVSDLRAAGKDEEAKVAAARVRFQVERLTTSTLDHAIKACGARSLNRPSPVERIHRDLSFYVRHDNIDHVLTTIGRHSLNEPHDLSFFKL
ncbi:MAG: alkylation response protein AidB-like acyl-CoA dehydrogenase [Candidatus Binatia bacterium]|jgi:alkylation response protein AidB-like acyl-CoA dehydrogenase